MNAMPTDRIRRSFSRSFGSYHCAAGPQARIARALGQRLVDLGAPRQFGTLFEIGCGTGHLTEALHQQFSFTRSTLNDLMAEARDTARRWGADFLQGDIRNVTWPARPDLIASASTVQWLDDPAAVVRRAMHEVAPEGWVAISGFGPDQYAELSALGSAARAPGLCAPDDLAAGIGPEVEILDLWQDRQPLWFDTPLDVLRHLRETGVNGRAAQVWTRADLTDFSTRYRAAFSGPEGVRLTYHPVWIIARKPG
ncbi:methyltransferase domain-containing protein [Ruegeria arenilitoris]|uniref:methyltransferase domain-containing protein n=1 Tax=Ruegeria arenilitoris TaxID=1173585 RepID=UPI00147FD784|nr:methyltransferase domain-containing protein [Ruegeria arenilitoris]